MLRALLARFTRPDWRKLKGAPALGTKVCALTELADERPKYVKIGSSEFLCFVTLRKGQPRAFVADCPHRHRPMGTAGMPALYGDGEIACHHHGALFSVDSGVCTRGPCKGQRLCPLPVRSIEGFVVVG